MFKKYTFAIPKETLSSFNDKVEESRQKLAKKDSLKKRLTEINEQFEGRVAHMNIIATIDWKFVDEKFCNDIMHIYNYNETFYISMDCISKIYNKKIFAIILNRVPSNEMVTLGELKRLNFTEMRKCLDDDNMEKWTQEMCKGRSTVQKLACNCFIREELKLLDGIDGNESERYLPMSSYYTLMKDLAQKVYHPDARALSTFIDHKAIAQCRIDLRLKTMNMVQNNFRKNLETCSLFWDVMKRWERNVTEKNNVQEENETQVQVKPNITTENEEVGVIRRAPVASKMLSMMRKSFETPVQSESDSSDDESDDDDEEPEEPVVVVTTESQQDKDKEEGEVSSSSEEEDDDEEEEEKEMENEKERKERERREKKEREEREKEERREKRKREEEERRERKRREEEEKERKRLEREREKKERDERKKREEEEKKQRRAEEEERRRLAREEKKIKEEAAKKERELKRKRNNSSSSSDSKKRRKSNASSHGSITNEEEKAAAQECVARELERQKKRMDAKSKAKAEAERVRAAELEQEKALASIQQQQSPANERIFSPKPNERPNDVTGEINLLPMTPFGFDEPPMTPGSNPETTNDALLPETQLYSEIQGLKPTDTNEPIMGGDQLKSFLTGLDDIDELAIPSRPSTPSFSFEERLPSPATTNTDRLFTSFE
nr:MAG: hypothetical protein [Apis mellifra filamentous-like virus]